MTQIPAAPQLKLLRWDDPFRHPSDDEPIRLRSGQAPREGTAGVCIEQVLTANKAGLEQPFALATIHI